MSKKRTSASKAKPRTILTKQLAGALACAIVVALFTGVIAGRTVLRPKDGTNNVTPITTGIDVLTYEEFVNNYKFLVDEYNTLAKSDASHISELNWLAPVINARGIKPEGAGGGYFAMTYVAPSCKRAIKSQSPSPLTAYQTYITELAPCE